MKFYYNGVLIRTSKTHNYTHAVIGQKLDDGKYALYGCRTSEEAAQSIITTEINRYKVSIENCKNAIKALNAGKSGYDDKFRGRHYYIKFGKGDTVESYEGYIERYR